MQKRSRNEWKKIVTAVKEVLGVDCSTRNINSTENLQNAIKKMAFKYARENITEDAVAMSEKHFLETQIEELKRERNKYKRMFEDATNANSKLVNRYEKEKRKTWQFWR